MRVLCNLFLKYNIQFLLLSAALLNSAIVFASPITYKCTYMKYSSIDGLKKVDSKFELNFLLDPKSGKAYITGNSGSEEVNIILNKLGKGISFLEITGSGNVSVTTIDSDGNSAHSRNMIISRKLIPSQYYGICEIKQ